MQFNTNNNNRKYKVEIISNSTIYVIKSNGYLRELYYLVLWKDYLKEENI